MKLFNLLTAALVCTALSQPVFAQQRQTPAQTDSSHDMQGMSDKNMSPLQKDTMAAMDKMNKAMMQSMMDPNPDMAWMKSMAAHHQGAIDMSEIVLKYTKDTGVEKEARKTAQENEKSLKELGAMMKKEEKKS